MPARKLRTRRRASKPGPALPQTIASYIWQTTAKHQLALSALSVAVFLISAVPLEIQRRIVNDAIKQGVVSTILWLGAAYAGIRPG